jgi:DNA-binding SARP family transcriptional activator/predicted ATPase
MSDALQIRVLGTFEVAIAETSIELPPSRKTRALLAYLAVTARTHQRERLCEMFWDLPDDPRGSLRWSLSKIRQILAASPAARLVADRNTVALLPGGFALDLAHLGPLEATAFEEQGTDALSAAAALFRDRFLTDLSLPRCPDFETWRIAIAYEVEVRRIRILQELVRRLQGEPERALVHANLLRTLLPSDEAVAERAVSIAEAARQRAAGLGPTRLPQASPAEGALDARRQATALAIDIVSPLLGVDDADPEVMMEAVEPLLALGTQIIERFGGSVVDEDQRGFTAVFGALHAIEGHARRAGQAALALRQEIERAAAGSARVRAALDSGEIILRASPGGEAGRRHGVYGAPLRKASQLARTLASEGVFATLHSRDAIGGALLLQAVDGVEEAPAQQLFAIIAETGSAWAGRHGLGRDMTPLIGRGAELLVLRQAFERAMRGHGQIAALSGEAGIGKSRLVEEFIRSLPAPSPIVMLAGALEFDAQESYAVIKRLLQTMCRLTLSEPRETRQRLALEHIEHLGADLAIAVPLLFLLDCNPEESEWRAASALDRARRIRDSVAVLLSLRARGAPLILIIEDLHWIDRESEAVLERVAAGIARQAILIITTTRLSDPTPRIGSAAVSHVTLEALNKEQATEFLCSIMGDDPSMAHSIPAIVAGTGGVPLFMEEVVRSLVQDGRLSGEPGHYVAAAPVAELPVPASVASMIAARIGRLSEAQRWVLQVAAVIGAEFDSARLSRLLSQDESDVRDVLERLQAVGFVVERQLYPQHRYAFRHALIEVVAYKSLSSPTRERLHGRLLDLLEADHLTDSDSVVESLARHAMHAGNCVKTLDYKLRAAQRALMLSAHQVALAHLGDGLRVLADLPDGRERWRRELDYQKVRGVALMAAKGWGAREVSQAYERAEWLCSQLGDKTELFTALRGRVQYYMISGQPEAADEIAKRCRVLTKSSRDEGIAIETHHMGWTNHFFMGNPAASAAHAERGIALYRPERDHALTFRYSGHDPGVCCRCFAGLAHWQTGDAEKAARLCGDALSLSQRLSHPLTTALAYWALGILHLFNAEPEATLHWAEKGIELCDEYALPLVQSQCLVQAGWAVGQMGDVGEGVAQMQRGADAIKATGASMGLPYFLALLAEAQGRVGDFDKALATVEEAVDTADRNAARFGLSEILRIKAELLERADASRVGEIEAILRRAIAAARAQGSMRPERDAAQSLARFLTTLQRNAEAAQLLAFYRKPAA